MQEQNIALGGEPSGHIIASDYLKTGDGIFVALRVLQTLEQTSNWDMDTFFKFPQIQINVPIVQKKDLALSPLRDAILNAEQLLHAGRLLVRYSGTEPFLRIMIEDDDYDHADSVGHNLSKKLQELLGESR
jgi:phosphoglucosamine mutase